MERESRRPRGERKMGGETIQWDGGKEQDSSPIPAVHACSAGLRGCVGWMLGCGLSWLGCGCSLLGKGVGKGVHMG